MMGFLDALASAGPYANNLHHAQTDNHTNISSLNFHRPDALPDAQPTVSKLRTGGFFWCKVLLPACHC